MKPEPHTRGAAGAASRFEIGSCVTGTSLVLTMHFAQTRLYPVTCQCVISFHQLTKLAGMSGITREPTNVASEVTTALLMTVFRARSTLQERALLLYSSLMAGSYVHLSGAAEMCRYTVFRIYNIVVQIIKISL